MLSQRLGNCITKFFGDLIQVVHFWGGDIIKFAGDAVTIVWGCDDEAARADGELLLRLAHGVQKLTGPFSSGLLTSEDSRYIIDKTKACQLACQCCLDLHRNLNGFDAGVDGKKFTLHIGVGFGTITILQVCAFEIPRDTPTHTHDNLLDTLDSCHVPSCDSSE